MRFKKVPYLLISLSPSELSHLIDALMYLQWLQNQTESSTDAELVESVRSFTTGAVDDKGGHWLTQFAKKFADKFIGQDRETQTDADEVMQWADNHPVDSSLFTNNSGIEE